MKPVVASILIGGLLGSAGGGAASAHPRHSHDVTLARFSERVSADVSHTLAQSPSVADARARSGTVTIGFKANPDGTARLITLLQSSGHADLDRRATRAVRRLSSLRPTPQGIGPNQRFSMTVLFAEGSESYPRERRRQLANAKLWNRWFTETERREVAPIPAQ